MTAPHIPPLPKVIGGKYRVIDQIGKGGMATVYSAVHLGTERRVAVKVMAVENEVDCDAGSTSDVNGASLTRFEREARIAGNLDTQHVARVFDTGFDSVYGPYIVMELLAGEDLKDLVRRIGPLRPELALRIIAQACIGIARAHTLGVVHRDVKASNIFLAHDEFGGRVVKVLDFGIAKSRRGDYVDAADPKTLTKTGAMLGSPHYMSPEQVLGTKGLDHRADIWSLGVVMYKCLSTRTPFDEQDTVGKIIVSIVQGSPPSVQNYAPWVPPEVAAIIARALKGPAGERFQSAEEMGDAIRKLIPGGDLAITMPMLTEMTDEERGHVKPRLSTKITIPDGTLAAKRLEQAAREAQAKLVAMNSGASEVDSTIDGAIASLRHPSTGPRALGSKIGMAALALIAGLAVVWGLSHHDPTSAPQVASASSAREVASVTALASASPPVIRHADVQILAPAESVEVDGAPATVQHGTVDVAGDLGSVHQVKVRAGGREATVEVILTDEGARPRVVSLPAAHGTAGTPGTSIGARKGSAPSTQPSPAKSAARFDTQFE